MAFLEELEKGIDSLNESMEMSAADLVATIKEKTIEVKGIHHHGGYNPFSYTFTDAFAKTLRDKTEAKIKAGEEIPDLNFDNISGWKVELPKKKIGKFWSIVESLRNAASRLYISGTKHMTESAFKKFLEKYREAEKKWVEEKANVELNFELLRAEFLHDAEETLRRAYDGEMDEAILKTVMDSVKRSIPTKEAYVNGITLSVDISETDNGLVFLSTEDKRTMEEIRSNRAKEQVTEMIAGNIQVIIDAANKALKAIYSPRTSSSGRELKWMEDRQILAFQAAMQKAEEDNLFSNPAIANIVESMKSAHSNMVRNLEGEAIDDLETILGKAYSFAEKTSILNDVSFKDSPLDEEEIRDIAICL